MLCNLQQGDRLLEVWSAGDGDRTRDLLLDRELRLPLRHAGLVSDISGLIGDKASDVRPYARFFALTHQN